MSDIQLTIEEPKPTDIFRVFRANHPETLAFNAPNVVAGPYTDFTLKDSITLLQPDRFSKPVSIVPLLSGPAAVSAASRQINLVCDVNEMLAKNNFDAAEQLLGRKLTIEEKQSKLMADKWAPIRERAARSAEFDDLKEMVRLSRKRYEAALTKYSASRTRAAKLVSLANAARLRIKAAADLQDFLNAAIAAKREEDDLQSAFGNIDLGDDGPSIFEMLQELNDDSGIFSDESIRAVHESIQDLAGRAPHDFASDEDEIASVVDRSLPPLPEGDEDDDDSIAETVIYRGKKDGEEKEDDTESIATTVKATRGLSNIYVFPWSDKPNGKLRKIDYKKRAEELQENYPSELSDILKGWDKSATTLSELNVKVDAAEDELARRAAEEAGKKQARNEVEQKKAEEPLAGNGVSLFTGLRKLKNHQDYVSFGPRFLIDLKRLKDKSEFSLAYPKSGQKPNLIRNAILTPALKEIVLAYLSGQPQDTTDLDEKEMAWLKLVWQQSGLQKAKPKLRTVPKRYRGKADLKARLKVLMGECIAGNDNPEVLREMVPIVDQLEDRKWISEKDIINSRRFISGE